MTERQIEILELFAEAGEQPSALRERRAWRSALRRALRHAAVIEYNRLNRFVDRFLRRRVSPIVPLPPEAYCSRCFAPWTDRTTLWAHERQCGVRRAS